MVLAVVDDHMTRLALALLVLLTAPRFSGAASEWSAGAARSFLAWRGEVGTVAHLQGALGYGKPWWTWAGLSADAWANENIGALTAGLRVALLAADLDVHWRVTRSWRRVPMAPLPDHRELDEGGGSTYRSVDATLSGVLPTPRGYLLWEGRLLRTLDLPAGTHMMDESLHAVVAPPLAGLAGLGWVADLRSGRLQAGASVERIFTSRGGDPYLRAGPVFSLDLGGGLDLRGSVLFPFTSPDRLPFWTGLSGGLVLGWRGATGSRPRPGAP